MRWRYLLVVAVLLPIGCAREERGDEPAATPGGGEVPQGDLAQGPPPSRGWTQHASYQGTVTAITGTSITILAAGQTAPREFPIEEWLVKEKAPPAQLLGGCYLPSDVRVGDRVEIMYADDGRTATCHEINILRRPGGRVPPDHAAIAAPFTRHHDLMNAQQDWEERRIPIPDQYHLGGKQGAIAPMPRDVLPPEEGPPRIPPAKP